MPGKFYWIVLSNSELAPTDAPAPALKTCKRKRRQFKETGIPVEDPQFTADCFFVQKQCNTEKCFCVKKKNGKPAYKGAEVPLGEDYACESK